MSRSSIRHIQATVAALEREWAADVGERRLDELRATIVELRATRQARRDH